MDKQLEDELCKIDPTFFEQLIACRENKMTQMDTCMFWGCAHGNGWFNPLKQLITETAFLNKILYDYKTNCKLIAIQIKEKFSELTIYHKIEGTYDDLNLEQRYIFDMVEKTYADLYSRATHECYFCCELCGHKNDKENPIVTTKGWLSRICTQCAKKSNREYRCDF